MTPECRLLLARLEQVECKIHLLIGFVAMSEAGEARKLASRYFSEFLAMKQDRDDVLSGADDA